LLNPDGTFLPAPELRDRFAAIGVGSGEPVAVYCGSGVVATQEIFAMSLAGIDAALYSGSWSEWITDPRRPVELGASGFGGGGPALPRTPTP
jgi:thiosulfate/3-mercaptopyruvate sulfurtransferase